MINFKRQQNEAESYKQTPCNTWTEWLGPRVVWGGAWQKFTWPNVRSEMCSAAERHQGSEAPSGQVMNTLWAQLMGAFREQMEMCRSLTELENTNAERDIDTCRHLRTITE